MQSVLRFGLGGKNVNIFEQIINNSVLVTAIISWFAAQVIKVVLTLIFQKKLDFSRFIGSGGMPSSHSSFVVALTVSVGFVDGFASTIFAVCTCLSLVVMYDAAGVRRSAGEQAKVLNKLVEDWGHRDFRDTDKKLKELLGHTPVEVFAGAILGIIVAVMMHI